jgi:hypothetical protein
MESQYTRMFLGKLLRRLVLGAAVTVAVSSALTANAGKPAPAPAPAPPAPAWKPPADGEVRDYKPTTAARLSQSALAAEWWGQYVSVEVNYSASMMQGMALGYDGAWSSDHIQFALGPPPDQVQGILGIVHKSSPCLDVVLGAAAGTHLRLYGRAGPAGATPHARGLAGNPWHVSEIVVDRCEVVASTPAPPPTGPVAPAPSPAP